MPSTTQREPRHTGLALAGVVAIPFVAVTLAARVGASVSGGDPRHAVGALLALGCGVACGLLVRRLTSSVEAHVASIIRAVHRLALEVFGGVIAASRRTAWGLTPMVDPTFVPVPTATGRRGPPPRLR